MMNLIILAVLLIGNIFSAISYSEETAKVIFNPNRGFYVPFHAKNGSTPTITASSLKWTRDTHETLIIYHIYDLNAFRNTDTLGDLFLSNMQADFDSLRANGFTAILSFNYNNPVVYTGTSPYNDAPVIDRVEKHLAQLQPILAANEDIIFAVVFGIIGQYGDQYNTDLYCGNTGGWWGSNQTCVQLRRRAYKAMADAVPLSRPLQLQSIAIKKIYLPVSNAISEDQAFNSSIPQARVGILDSGYLNPDNKNSFTWYDDSEKAFYMAEAQYVINGGRVSALKEAYYSCGAARTELSMLGASYVRRDENEGVFQAWKDQGCYDELRDKLGYRYVLNNANLTFDGESFDLAMVGANKGFSATFSKRTVILTVESADWKGGSCSASIPSIDIRRWKGNGAVFKASIKFSFSTPVTFFSNASLKLTIADPVYNTHKNSRVVFANTETMVEDRSNLLTMISGPFKIENPGSSGIILSCSGNVNPSTPPSPSDNDQLDPTKESGGGNGFLSCYISEISVGVRWVTITGCFHILYFYLISDRKILWKILLVHAVSGIMATFLESVFSANSLCQIYLPGTKIVQGSIVLGVNEIFWIAHESSNVFYTYWKLQACINDPWKRKMLSRVYLGILIAFAAFRFRIGVLRVQANSIGSPEILSAHAVAFIFWGLAELGLLALLVRVTVNEVKSGSFSKAIFLIILKSSLPRMFIIILNTILIVIVANLDAKVQQKLNNLNQMLWLIKGTYPLVLLLDLIFTKEMLLMKKSETSKDKIKMTAKKEQPIRSHHSMKPSVSEAAPPVVPATPPALMESKMSLDLPELDTLRDPESTMVSK